MLVPASLLAACGDGVETTRRVSESTALLLSPPARFCDSPGFVPAGEEWVCRLSRPPVWFDHERHVTKLVEQGGKGEALCLACHPRLEAKDGAGQATVLKDLGMRLFAPDDKPDLPRFRDADDFKDQVHKVCFACHEEQVHKRLSQPPNQEACGACHSSQVELTGERAPMSFDYSLHARHDQAQVKQRGKDKSCEACHHLEDPVSKKLVYAKDKEEACLGCHPRRPSAAEDPTVINSKGPAPTQPSSLRDASHQACVNCHLRQAAKTPSDPKEPPPPTGCAGCHDEAQKAKIKRIDKPPRLDRKQGEVGYVKPGANTARLVNFSHANHEPVTRFCTDCHHTKLEACGNCHTTSGLDEFGRSEKSGGISLAQAFHMPGAEHSCVGCHQQRAEDKACAGCHAQRKAVVSDGSCVRCHDGPAPAPGKPGLYLVQLPLHADDVEPAMPVALPLADLPKPVARTPLARPLLAPPSDDCPEKVNITVLKDLYEVSPMPHAKILTAIDKGVRTNKLAEHFHGGLEGLCAGCHHHSPLGVRPPACRSCHAQAAPAGKDHPDLLTAYHRQCLGCHQQMDLKKVEDCKACHAPKGEAGKEVSP